MSAGTITVTNGSATVTGSGTSFTSELKAGDFIGVIAGGTPYTLIVASIASDTQLITGAAYSGPTATGLAWNAVPASLLYAVTQQIMNDMGTALRGMNSQLTNWQKIYSDSASVTVERPDKTTFTGPSWGYVAAQYTNKANKGANSDITSLSGLTTALSIDQGGTGQKTASLAWKALLDGRTPTVARNDLGLGAAALLKDGGAAGDVSKIGDQGGPSPTYVYFQTGTSALDNVNLNAATGTGLFPNLINGATASNSPTSQYFYLHNIVRIPVSGSNGAMTQFLYPYFTPGAAGYRDGLIWFRGFNGGTWGSWVSVWSTNRTTVDANGFVKSASPILRLSNAPEAMDDSFTEGFTLSGFCAVNHEAEGARAEKVGIGQYRIVGAKGLAKEGWTLEMPQDINKNPLCFVEVNETESGAIMVNVYKRKFDVDTAMVIAGEQMDIPDGRWIDLRLDMPEASAQATTGVESN